MVILSANYWLPLPDGLLIILTQPTQQTWDSVVSVVTMLQVGQSRVQILATSRDFRPPHNVQTRPVDEPAPYSTGTGFLARDKVPPHIRTHTHTHTHTHTVRHNSSNLNNKLYRYLQLLHVY